MLKALFGAAVVAIFIWLLVPGRRSSTEAKNARASNARDSKAGEKDNSAQIGFGTGLLGGDIEDAAIARYALDRTKKDSSSSNARDLGTALGMQNGLHDPTE